MEKTVEHTQKHPEAEKSETEGSLSKDHANRGSHKHSRLEIVSEWVARICFTIVFIVNFQCAWGYIFDPAGFTASFQLAGLPGEVAVKGVGIVFMMWIVTYPAFIVSPKRFKCLGVVVLIQQLVALIGESSIYFSILPLSGYAQLTESILRYIQFDSFGLVIMLASFIFFMITSRHENQGYRI